MLKQHFKRLFQILRHAEHHFTAGLQLALLQLGHVGTFDADIARHVRLADAFGFPPDGDSVRDHGDL